MTNFERIKEMSVEEMAEIIYGNSDFDETIPYYQNSSVCDEIIDTPNGIVPKEMCLNCVKKWLESEVEEE